MLPFVPGAAILDRSQNAIIIESLFPFLSKNFSSLSLSPPLSFTGIGCHQQSAPFYNCFSTLSPSHFPNLSESLAVQWFHMVRASLVRSIYLYRRQCVQTIIGTSHLNGDVKIQFKGLISPLNLSSRLLSSGIAAAQDRQLLNVLCPCLHSTTRFTDTASTFLVATISVSVCCTLSHLHTFD